ncbi:MAG TPA: hypothetical protein VIL96_04550 [Gaiellaceae bacterium]|jgi:hypothetical protein
MTTHEDSERKQLERDLQLLAKPGETDDAFRVSLRAALIDRLQPLVELPRWKRPVFRFAVAGGAAAAVAASVVLALVGTESSGGPAAAQAAIVRHALQAVTSPTSCILHVRVSGIQNGTQVVGESWQETTPPYASRGLKGPIGQEGESADDGTTSYTYDTATNTIHERPDSSPPTFTDPISVIRKELAAGQAQVAGTEVIAGVSLYKIDLPHGLVGYFDKSDYRPRYLDDPTSNGLVRLHVVAFEHLTLNPANRDLLSLIAQHPNAHVDTNPQNAPGK